MPESDAKLQFLRQCESYSTPTRAVECIETHMSWVFLTDDSVYKLKKPVVFPFLDFSTLASRASFCREEVRLNARLAPGIYLGVVALVWASGAFALVPEAELDPNSEITDWLVRMRRLPSHRALHQCIADGQVTIAQIDELLAVLTNFYRAASVVTICAQDYPDRFRGELAVTREILLRPQFHLRGAALALNRLDTALSHGADLLRRRASRRCLVDGHGDLRPNHIFLLQPPVVIDCIEFNPKLRQLDPFDEMAFLSLECDMAGAPWIGQRLTRGLAHALSDNPPRALHHLYTAHRALLHARFAMAHLLDPQPRTPEKWEPMAQAYVARTLVAIDAFNDAMQGGLPQ